jgi:hypothetical protein
MLRMMNKNLLPNLMLLSLRQIFLPLFFSILFTPSFRTYPFNRRLSLPVMTVKTTATMMTRMTARTTFLQSRSKRLKLRVLPLRITITTISQPLLQASHNKTTTIIIITTTKPHKPTSKVVNKTTLLKSLHKADPSHNKTISTISKTPQASHNRITITTRVEIISTSNHKAVISAREIKSSFFLGLLYQMINYVDCVYIFIFPS